MSHPTDPLDAAIADLQSRRALLGDAVVDAAVAALRAQRAVAAPPAPPPAPQPGSPAAVPADPQPRLRQVSILFADIVGSTALLQSAAADEALAWLSPALARFAAVVREAGGEVLRFTGDGLKAAFGTQGLREDEAERAVRAGLALLREAQAHAAHLQVAHGVSGFGVRVGVHTGPVVLGGGVEADRTAMGHAVHLAARLEQAAPPGGLLISRETASQVRGLFELQAQPPLSVRGHDEPLQTFRVQGAIADAERTPQRGVQGVVAPMIGREAEWRQLQALFALARDQRQGACAWVLADAGLGKTRLRRELLAAWASQAGQVWQARAHPSDTLQPFGLVRQLLARAFDISDASPAAEARARFEAALVPRLARDALARARRLGHLLGLDYGGDLAVQALGRRELQEQAYAAWSEALLPRPGQGPAVVVFDDLQWADDASLDFVQRLAAQAARSSGADGQPLFVLLLARPVLAERLRLPEASARQCVLSLGPLPDQAGRQLVQALLAAVQPPAPALEQLLLERAAGNPFYLEELLRVLIEQGAVDTSGSSWRVDASRLAGLQLPATLVGVLQARLDSLPAGELQALQQASIVGPVFWDEALQALDAAAVAALPALQRRTLVDRHASSALAGATERAFHHGLLHEVTYGTVLTPARRQGHARVAQWLLAQRADRADEFMGLIGEHFERAGDVPRALAFYDRASKLAFHRWATRQTVALTRRALALPGPLPAAAAGNLLIRQADALQALGDWAQADQTLDRASALATDAADHALMAQLLTSRMLQADAQGHPERAAELARQALSSVARDGTPRSAPAAALAHGELAWLAVGARHFDEAASHLQLGLQQAQQAALLPPEDGGYDGYGIQLRQIELHALKLQERHAAIEQAVTQALAELPTGPAARFPLDRLHLHVLHAESRQALGDLAGAQRAADEAVALAQLLELHRATACAALAQCELALVELALERADARPPAAADLPQSPAARARHWWAAADAATRAADYAPYRPRLQRARATLAWADGDLATARQAWQAAETLWRDLQGDADAAAMACRRAVHLDDAEQARVLVQAALQAAAQDGAPHHGWLSPEALLDCHLVLAAQGDPLAATLLADLQARLRQQQEPPPAPDARQRLLTQVPHWRAVTRLSAGSPDPSP